MILLPISACVLCGAFLSVFFVLPITRQLGWY